MPKLARPTLAQSAAAAATAVALLLAVEAWSQLQQPETLTAPLNIVLAQALASIGLPLLAVCAAVLASRLIHRNSGPAQEEPGPGGAMSRSVTATNTERTALADLDS